MRRRAEHWQAMRGHWHLALAVGVLSPLGYILVLYALRNGAPLSLVAPAREMSMMLGTLAGMLLLRETVGIGRLAGCAAIQIGRESGRERGCKYVEVSAVAVSLKKKKK